MESSTVVRLLLIFTLQQIQSISTAWDPNDCPGACSCESVPCFNNGLAFCNSYNESWIKSTCTNFSEGVVKRIPKWVDWIEILPTVNVTDFTSAIFDLRSIKVLSVPLTEDAVPSPATFGGTVEISYLNLSYGVLRSVPDVILQVQGLKMLNLSNNAIQGSVKFNATLKDLASLDLSSNAISEFRLLGSSNLSSLYLQSNQLHILPSLENVALSELDISDNFFLLRDTLNEHNEDDTKTRLQNCAIRLPSRVTSLYLRGNLFWKIPDKECGPLAGLVRLEHLYLERNSIYGIGESDFSPSMLESLVSLRLDDNEILSINPKAFDGFKNLKLLSLNGNRLRSIPIPVINHFQKQLEFSSLLPSEVVIRVSENSFSCDCTQVDFLKLVQSLPNSSAVLSKDDIVCLHPYWLYEAQFASLTPSDLQCFDVVLEKPKNVTCDQYEDCSLECVFDGLPYPDVYWTTPSGKEISHTTLGQDPSLRKTYSLSEDGRRLVILDLQFHKTGIYKCTGTNGNSTKSGVVQVGVVLTPVGSIVAIAVSAVSFIVAIVLNSVNLCHYYCQHLADQRKRREEEAMSFKMETPIKSKRKGFHESEASLNANKYYRKYDFTCQQVFLDTVIKGAHTVKQTLYDARNSGFSNNVWEYASHLRDRLHIELPSSVQFPRVSMPSISMPTISMPTISMPSIPTLSMPSMPNFQAINTNIEKLGTSVMHRSHNLATSVGSVFTLRWLRSGTSDNESDSDGEGAGVSHIEVHVHNANDAMSSQGSKLNGEDLSDLMPGTSQPGIGTLTSRDAASDGTRTPRRTKSVRFSEGSRPSMSKLRRSASFDALTRDTRYLLSEHISPVDEEPARSVTVTLVTEVDPMSYQYETTV